MAEIIDFRISPKFAGLGAPAWEQAVSRLENAGLVVAIVTHRKIEGFPPIADRLTFETMRGVQIRPEAFVEAEALRLAFENDASVREQMSDYHWSVGGVVSSI